MRIYFDYNATAPLCREALEAMNGAAGLLWGNPSSVHAEGRAARDALEAARRQVALSLGAAAEDVIFTSGGTEADLLGVGGLAGGAPVALSALEHPAVVGAATRPIAMPVDGEGRLTAAAVDHAIEAGAQVVAIQLANHELGTLQDVAALAERARAGGARVHCDAVQGLGRVVVDVAALGVDTVAVSAHKIGGPKGVGALWVRPGAPWAPPRAGAGHQERDRRPGTENLLGAIGFGAAAAAVAGRLEAGTRIRELAALLEDGLRRQGARIHGAGAARVGNTVSAAFAGAAGEVVVTALDLAGVAVSTGAACTSGTVEPSPVVRALGLDEDAAAEAVRFSLGPENTAAEVQVVLELLPDIVERARRFG